MSSEKQTHTAQPAHEQGLTLPSASLAGQVRADTAALFKEVSELIAASLRREPLPKTEADALMYLTRTRVETQQRIDTTGVTIASYIRHPELIQTDDQKSKAEDLLTTYLASRRRVEIIDEIQAGKGTMVEKVERLQDVLGENLIPMAAGYIYYPIKTQYGRNDAFAVLAGLLLARFRQSSTVKTAIQKVASDADNPLMYETLLAIAQGRPDTSGVGEFHTVFNEARKILNGLRNEFEKALTNSDMTEDLSVDAEGNPEQLLMAEFESQERAQLHDDRKHFLELLTQSQQTVLLLDAEGLSRREIAERMGIGEETVKTHLANARKHVTNWNETGKLPRGKKQ